MLHVRISQPLNFQRGAFTVLTFHAVVLLSLIHSCGGQHQVIGPSQPVVAAVGEDIILPCHLDPVMDAFGMILEWARPDLNPRFVFLRRDGVELEGANHPSYEGRTLMFTDQLKHGNISLKLSKVRISDEGRYRCFIPEMNIDSTVQLVVGAASSPVIQINTNSSGVVLQCESAGWYPEPEVFWLDGEGNLLSAGPTETVRGPDDLYTVNSRVTVEKRHSNSFTCRVHQKNINQTRETHIQFPDHFFVVPSTPGSPGVIIGSVVGCAALVTVFAVVFVVWKWRQKKTKNKRRSHEEGAEHTEKEKMIITSKRDNTGFQIVTEEEGENVPLMTGREEENDVDNEEEKIKPPNEHTEEEKMITSTIPLVPPEGETHQKQADMTGRQVRNDSNNGEEETMRPVQKDSGTPTMLVSEEQIEQPQHLSNDHQVQKEEETQEQLREGRQPMNDEDEKKGRNKKRAKKGKEHQRVKKGGSSGQKKLKDKPQEGDGDQQDNKQESKREQRVKGKRRQEEETDKGSDETQKTSKETEKQRQLQAVQQLDVKEELREQPEEPFKFVAERGTEHQEVQQAKVMKINRRPDIHKTQRKERNLKKQTKQPHEQEEELHVVQQQTNTEEQKEQPQNLSNDHQVQKEEETQEQLREERQPMNDEDEKKGRNKKRAKKGKEHQRVKKGGSSGQKKLKDKPQEGDGDQQDNKQESKREQDDKHEKHQMGNQRNITERTERTAENQEEQMKEKLKETEQMLPSVSGEVERPDLRKLQETSGRRKQEVQEEKELQSKNRQEETKEQPERDTKRVKGKRRQEEETDKESDETQKTSKETDELFKFVAERETEHQEVQRAKVMKIDRRPDIHKTRRKERREEENLKKQTKRPHEQEEELHEVQQQTDEERRYQREESEEQMEAKETPNVEHEDMEVSGIVEDV